MKGKGKILGISILVFMIGVIAIFSSTGIIQNRISSKNKMGEREYSQSETEVIWDKSVVRSVEVSRIITGVGPFDKREEGVKDDSKTEDGQISWVAGDDYSADDKIVRSFDQIAYTLQVHYVSVNQESNKIMIEAEIPETSYWDLDAMSWIENAKEENGILTGSYTIKSDSSEVEEGLQELVMVLQVEGAKNGMEIKPTFKAWIDGNEEQKEAIPEKTIVSAKGKYNIQLKNNAFLNKRTTVELDNQDIEGRMYGFSIVVSLYNDEDDNGAKGLKGIQYPEGEINFDIDLRLEESPSDNPSNVKDITNENTPILWQYRLPSWNYHTPGEIEGREILNERPQDTYDEGLPLGIDNGDRKYTTYNSGKLKIVQENNQLHVTIKDYDFDKDFPRYNASWGIREEWNHNKIYSDNVGVFSVGYMQILVPDMQEVAGSTDYYLTLTDSNMVMQDTSGKVYTEQMKTEDDKVVVQHYQAIDGRYEQRILLRDRNNESITSDSGTGDGKATLGQEIIVDSRFEINIANDYDIYTANRFLKFDAEAYQPKYFSDNAKYRIEGTGNPVYKIWYVTKANGENWNDGNEMNNANITDDNLELYNTLEEIPQNKLCIGIYIELIDGKLAALTGFNNTILFPFEIKETAQINTTYGITQNTQYWVEKLDRSIYTIENKGNFTYPEVEWDSGNRQYIKTEYDENGVMLPQTHQGWAFYGNTVLVLGANLSGEIKAIDNNNVEKVNYNLGNQESEVTFQITPIITENLFLVDPIENVTLKAEVTLPKGLKYIAGSSRRDEKYYEEPTIVENEDGSTTLSYMIYRCTVGEPIEPITFQTKIDNETENNTQYKIKQVVQEVIDEGEISKIGNSEITNRTATETINVINMSSHRIYKEVQPVVIERNGEITYRVVYKNASIEEVANFKMLDILPYNGDQRGSNYHGNYTVKTINVSQGSEQTNPIEIFTTNNEQVRQMQITDENLQTTNQWSKKISGEEINEQATAILLTGKVEKDSRVILEVTLQTHENEAKDLYKNNATADVGLSKAIETGIVETAVISRAISGTVWEDMDKDGVMNNGEATLQGVTVKLLDENNQELARTQTNENGEYIFENLKRENYKVEIEYDGSVYQLTKKLAGKDLAVNSKFNPETNQTDEITTLVENGNVPEFIARNINAGLCREGFSLELTKYRAGTVNGLPNVKFNLKGEGISEQGRTLTTNKNGNISLEGLLLNYYYILTEVTTPGGYAENNEAVIFKVQKEDGELVLDITQNSMIRESRIEQSNQEGTPILHLEIENEPKYELNIIKYKQDTEETIKGVTFNLKGEGLTEEGKNYITNSEGLIKVANLIPEKEYTLQEIATNVDYMLNSQIIQFKLHRENGILKVQILNGTIKQAQIEQSTEELAPKLTLKIENEPKYNLQITKTEKGTNTPIANVRFQVKGKGRPEEGTIFVTNSNGIAITPELEIGETYTIKEVYAKGYLVDETEFTIKLERIDGELQVIYNEEKEDGRPAIRAPKITLEANQLPKVEISLENEKKSTYSLELTKIREKSSEEEEEAVLEGAKFEITGLDRDASEEKQYVTAKDGKIVIENLYENEEYTLTETMAPDGYKISREPVTFKAVNIDGTLQMQITQGSFTEEAQIEGKTIKVKWDNRLLFKLEKIDEETGKPLQGAKYTIQDLEGNNAKDLSGEEVGTIENINGNDMRVITTDENGIASAEIAPGLYQVTEVQAPFGYELSENPVQYFGIEKAQEEVKQYQITNSTQIDGNYNDIVERLIPTSDGGTLVSGIFHGSITLVKDGEEKEYKGRSQIDNRITGDGIIIKYDKDYQVQWVETLCVSQGMYISDIVETQDEGFVIVGYVIDKGSEIYNQEGKLIMQIEGVTGYTAILMRYKKENEGYTLSWTKAIKGNGEMRSVVRTKENRYYATGGFYSQTADFGNGNILENAEGNGNVSTARGFIMEYDIQTGDTIWAEKISGQNEAQAFTIWASTQTNDNGVLIGGGHPIDGTKVGIIQKYDKNNKPLWSKPIEIEGIKVTSVAATKDGQHYVIGGIFQGTVTIGEKEHTSKGGLDALVFQIDKDGNIEWSQVVQGTGADLINYVIATQDNGIVTATRIGGEVTIGDETITADSADGLIVKYDTNGKIQWIKQLKAEGTNYATVVKERENGNLIEAIYGNSPALTLEDGKTYSAKNGSIGCVVAELEETVTQETVPETQEITFQNSKSKYNVYTKVEGVGGTISGYTSGDEALYEEGIPYQSDSTKTIEIKPMQGYGIKSITINGEEISIAKREDGTVLLDKFTNMSEDKHVVVSFTPNPAEVTVYHYIDGTTTPVPLPDGGEAQEETILGEIGKEYTTTPKEFEKYILVEEKMPENANGTMDQAKTEVIYYYQLKPAEVIVHHYIDGTEEKVAEDQHISGKLDDPYETSEKTDLTDYEVVETKIPSNKTGIMQEEITEVIYYYQKIPKGHIIVHHYEEFTNEKIIDDGVVIEDEIEEGRIGQEVQTYAKQDLKEYELIEMENSITETIEEDEKEVIYYYRLKPAKVIVQYREEGTEKVIATEEIVNGQVREYYNVENLEKEILGYNRTAQIPHNYEGNMTLEDITVIYYYTRKPTSVTTNQIQKGGTEQITEEDSKILYSISYLGEIKDYIGNATVIITDMLPYEIDESRSNLSGGTYNKDNKTITWEERIENIDTYTNGRMLIRINKDIEVVYKDINYGVQEIVNKAKAVIKLEEIGQEEETPESIAKTKVNFVKNVVVTKKWVDTNNNYTIPEMLNVKIKNGDEVVAQENLIEGKVIAQTSDDGTVRTWKYTFTNLPKYDEEGNEINYTVEEKEVIEQDLSYYEAQIDQETKTITNTYIGPIISVRKEAITSSGLNYVTAGDTITYNIMIKNEGGISKEVTVKDKVPEGSSFKEGSIRINGESSYVLAGSTEATNLETLTQQDLENGLKILVAEKKDEAPTEITLSFSVVVNEDAIGDIKNKAIYIEENERDPENAEEKETNETSVPVVTYQKQAQIVRNTEETQTNIPEGAVTADDEIIYTITITNSGTAVAEGIEVKDSVPEGTTLKQAGNNATIKEGKEITWTIEKLEVGETKTVSFTVKVNYSQDDRKITNTAYINDKPSNETQTEYKKPEMSLITKIEKTGESGEKTAQIITDEQSPIYYEIKYTATINNFVGNAAITFVDTLPYEIDIEQSDLKSLGTRTTMEDLGPGKYVYDQENKTITWMEIVEDIDTYRDLSEATINRSKAISLKYIYPDNAENLSGNVENTVTANTQLKEPKEPTEDDPSTEKIVKEEEKQDDYTVVVKIPTHVTVHHYIYDAKTDTPTTVKIAPDETINTKQENGKEVETIVGDSYATTKSNEIPANYTVINETPEKYKGTMTKTPIEVIYYYKLIDETVESSISKTAKADKTVERVVDSVSSELREALNRLSEEERETLEENGTIEEPQKVQVEVLTTDGGAITYTIQYKVTIKDYLGKAKVSIVDTLPTAINLEKSDLAGGKYNSVDNTITWEEEITGINTFEANKAYEKTITKQISLVYEGQNKVAPITNTVKGTIKTYYPDDYPEELIDPENPDKEKTVDEKEETETVEQEYKVNKEVEKVWEDNNNEKGKRPESVKVQLIANGQNSLNGQELPNVILESSNNWSHTFTNLIKYDGFGNEIAYSVQEFEVNEEDLAYYEPAKVISSDGTNKIIVTNTYRLTNTELDNSSIEKTGTDEITNSKQEVDYKIKYNVDVKDYIGHAIVTITDTLPYAIDTTKSNLAGGVYNEDLRTITWVQNLGYINTTKYEENTYPVAIEKDITVVYKDLDATVTSITNFVNGTIEFTENETKNEVTDEHETRVEIRGKVIVKYIDKTTGKEITYTVKPGETGNEEGNETITKTYGYEIENKAGTGYTTEQKEIYGYTYVENSGNTVGVIKEGTIEVIYYYERTKASDVTVKYVDEEGNELVPEEKIEGNIGDPYKTEEKDIEDYELEEVTGDSPEGTLDENPKEVVYHYKRIPTTVIVRYLEKGTDRPLAFEDTIDGKVGDNYETTRKVIEGYQKADPEPENANGKMTKDTIIVTYYYEKIPSGKITVKYVDIDTKQEIIYINEDGEQKTYTYELQGYIGDKYETSEKEIPYYEYLSNLEPVNKNGIYQQDDDTVIYYYRKLPFNISVEKTIAEVIKDGQNCAIGKDGKLMKIEVVSSKLQTTNIQVKYNITVTNTGEIEGSAKVVDKLPVGFKLASTNSSYWEEQKDGSISTTVELKAKETKRLEVTLVWKNGATNFGSMTNRVQVTDTKNPANYLETSLDDNTSEATVVMSIQTGKEQKVLVVALGTISSGGLLVLLYQYQRYQKERNRAIRHVVLEGKNVVIKKKKQK